jgi:neopullulanase
MSIITPDWVKDAIFYQIFPDRFARSRRFSERKLNFQSWESDPTPFDFKGGDLFGIVEHLDYLQDLGINAIYLNPITASAANHRYHTYDYFHIDPLLGGDEAFRELLDAAHARGMRIIPDGVFNHASRGIWQFNHVLENGSGSPYVDWFTFNPDRLNGKKPWGAYPGRRESHELRKGTDSYRAIGYVAWWNLPALPKFNTNTPAVREFLWNAAVHWIKFGADGWRLDVASEIDDDSFWQEFRRRVKEVNPDAYLVGEIWNESQRWLKGDQFDAVMNYLLTEALVEWLIGRKAPSFVRKIGDWEKSYRPLDAQEFSDRIEYLNDLYDPEINFVQFNLLDSHDTPRFLTAARNDESALKLAWLFLFTYHGTPCIYYGDEIGLAGGPDPECRKAFPWDEKEWNLPLREYLKNLIQLRKDHPTLRRGSFQKVYVDRDVYAYTRFFNDEKILVVLNSSKGTKKADITLTQPGIREKPPAILFGTGSIKEGDQTLKVKLAARSGLVIKI